MGDPGRRARNFLLDVFSPVIRLELRLYQSGTATLGKMNGTSAL